MEKKKGSKEQKYAPRSQSGHTTVLHGAEQHNPTVRSEKNAAVPPKAPTKGKPFCPYCNSTEHYLTQCTVFTALTKDEAVCWIKKNKRRWRCARFHMAKDCDLKKPCRICQGLSFMTLINGRVTPKKVVASTTPQQRPRSVTLWRQGVL